MNPTRKLRTGTPIDPAEYTPCFSYQPVRSERGQQILCCENIAVDKIANEAATPAYVYSGGAIEAAYQRLDRAFGALPHAICYAVKANSNLAILKLLAK